jgi:hypothetical protein
LNNWTAATQKHYGFESLSQLQVTWLDWVRRGSPAITAPETMLAQGELPHGSTAATATPVRPVAYDGWYDRQRNRAWAEASSNSAATPAEANPPRSAAATQSADAEEHPSSLSRPQAAGSPLPSALQWADGAGSYLQPVPAVRVADPVPYFDPLPTGRY